MGSNPDPFARGFGGAMGTLFGTVIGRIFLGATMVLGGATVGTKLGRVNPWTSLDDKAVMEKHQRLHDRIEGKLELIQETCTEHRLEPQHDTANARLSQLERENVALRQRIDAIAHKHVQEWRE